MKVLLLAGAFGTILSEERRHARLKPMVGIEEKPILLHIMKIYATYGLMKMYNNLIKYKDENTDKIQKIAAWYKENFFIGPTEENVIKAFKLD